MRWYNRILFWLLYGIWYTISLLPMWFHHGLTWVLYLLVAHVLHYRRRVIRRNLANSFPEKSDAERRTLELQFYRFFCDYLAETVKFATISRRNIKRRMTFTGTELVNQVLNEGQDVALMLGHYGNWEWITTLRLAMENPNAGYGHIYHPLENEVFDRLFLTVRNRMGSQSIAMHDTLRFLRRCHDQGWHSVIGYISDQVPLWQNIHHWLTFMNQETPVFTGVERIARKYDQAVFYVDVQRVKRGYYTAQFKLITRHPADLPEFEITNRCFQMLETTIRRAPQYWLWSHNRWKRTREEFDRNYQVINGRVVARKPSMD